MTNTSVRPGFLPSVLSWTFGIMFLFASILLGIFTMPAFTLLIAGLIVLPPTRRLISRHAKRDVPRWLTITAVIFGIGAFGSAVEPPAATPESSVAATDTDTPEAEAPTPQPASEEDQIRQLVQGELKGNNNMGKPYLRKVNIVEQVNGGWGVFVEFNAGENLTTNMQKGSIESNMADVYTALYTSGKDVQTATVAAYFPLVDKYGNESEAAVYKTRLNRSEADKVNWSTDRSTLRHQILPGVWEVMLLHPEFR